ncbi:MAG: LacI family DNA-binding transcriptional regulator [Anaerolineae bacterium]|nr:LacI family DNA-binding transcriptional regulator [Anaerolineae bacterium]
MSQRKQRRSAPTILEVARHVGVSPTTVSRVLNNYPHIREDVRNSVLQAIADLGYEPNRVAQRLRATHSRLLGMIVTDITNPFLNTIMASIEAVFFSKGFSVLMSNTTADPRKELEYLSMMENEGVAGLIIAPTSENVDRVAELAEDGLPVVVIDRRMTSGRVDVVLSDNVMGARQAVEHLISLGHQRIGHIGGPLHLTSGRERYQGYQAAMHDAGIDVPPDWVRFGDHRHDSGYQNALELLAVTPNLTALFIENNMMTLGAMNAIHDRGMRVPDEIAIVGFDDMPWYKSLNPPLTVIAQQTHEIGVVAASRLLERIDQPNLPARADVLPTSLIVRASSGAGRR